MIGPSIPIREAALGACRRLPERGLRDQVNPLKGFGGWRPPIPIHLRKRPTLRSGYGSGQPQIAGQAPGGHEQDDW